MVLAREPRRFEAGQRAARLRLDPQWVGELRKAVHERDRHSDTEGGLESAGEAGGTNLFKVHKVD